jgi:hypothetical protein
MRRRGQHSWLRYYATIPDEVIGFFQLTLSFQPRYGPGIDSAANRNEYQESFLGLKGDQRVKLTVSQPYMSRFSGKYGSLDISQPHGTEKPVTRIALHVFFLYNDEE